jgi:oligopeptide transport system substrate-binding protein
MIPETAKDYAAQFQLISGGAEFFRWRQDELDRFPDRTRDMSPAQRAGAAKDLWDQTERKFDELVGLQTPDERTLIVHLERPVPYFLDLCELAVFYPVYPPLVKRYETVDPETGRLQIKTGWTKPGQMVSNGPFKLTLWRYKRDMRMERNPYWWDTGSLNIDSIAMPSVEDDNACVLAFESGSVDWVSEITAPYRADMLAQKRQFYMEHESEYNALVAQGLDPIEIDRRLPRDKRKNIHAFPAFGTYFYNFNCMAKLPDGRDNPFAAAKVRKAFTMAVDKDRIVNQVRRIGERTAAVLIPPGSLAGYTSPAGLKYDPAAARQLLAEAGYPGGKGFPTVDILFNKDGGHDVIAQAIAKDWQENLGVPVSLAQKEIKVFKADLYDHNFMVCRAGWYGDYPDPQTFLDINRTGDGNNDRGYSNPDYDALLDKANNELDPARRLAILSEAERMIVEDELPLIPIFHYVQVTAFDPDRISGITSHPRQEQNIYMIDVLGDGKGAEKPRSIPPPGRQN